MPLSLTYDLTSRARVSPTVRRWRRVTASLLDTYRPELHYMRGPGPKWQEKHARRGGTLALPRQDMPCAWQGAVRGGENVEGFPLAKLIWSTLLQLTVALLVAAIIVIGLTNPSGAQTSPHNQNLFEQCMRDWDRATHMTKKQWAGACQRVLQERGDSAQPLRQFKQDGQAASNIERAHPLTRGSKGARDRIWQLAPKDAGER